MTSKNLRIFSYLPNPRLFKSTIVGRICGVEIEIRGAKPNELSEWLWDFDARPLSKEDKERKNSTVLASKGFDNELFKTSEFLAAHPFGNVPAAFSPDGKTGVFESNSIMRSVARIGENKKNVYGFDAFSSSRIDSFLDSSLVFACDSQAYLLSLMKDTLTVDIYNSVASAFTDWLNGVERALSNHKYLSSDHLTLADVCFACEIALLYNEKYYKDQLENCKLDLLVNPKNYEQFPRSWRHFEKLVEHPDFQPDLGPYLRKLEDLGK